MEGRYQKNGIASVFAFGMSYFKTVPMAISAVGAVIICVITYISLPGLFSTSGEAVRDTFSPAELESLRPGDIVLRKGSGTVSDLIVTALGEGFEISHAGIVVSLPAGDGLAVVHTLNGTLTGVDGVQIQTVDNFNLLSRANSLVVVRPRVNEHVKESMVASAFAHLDAKTPFDNAYNLSDRNALYCSEFLIDVFETAGFDYGSLIMTGPVLGFRVFFDPARFQVIVSHNPTVPVAK